MIDPIILFFLLGAIAGLLRSELRLPAAVYEFVSIVLLLSIGLKGGVELAKQPFATLLPHMLAVVAMGFVLTLVAFPVLRYLGRFKRADAASIAAHYGSVSVGTFAVVVAYLGSRQIAFEEHMPLLLVMLEVPAILVGIVLARGLSRETRWRSVAHEVFLGKGIVLLLGGLLIGWAAGPEGLKPIEPLFFDLFKGFLAVFLLEMGLITAKQVGSLRLHGPFLIAFGIGMPLVSAVARRRRGPAPRRAPALRPAARDGDPLLPTVALFPPGPGPRERRRVRGHRPGHGAVPRRTPARPLSRGF